MLLEVQGVRKTFFVKRGWGRSERVKALRGVDLSMAKGEPLGLVGESGSGKSTLARVILGLASPDEGKVFLKGKDVYREGSRDWLSETAQMVFQDPSGSLDPRWIVRNILEEGLPKRYDGRWDQRLKRMREVLTAVELPWDALGRFPHEFSGGERQRIAIARALLRNPDVMILDEAVSSLDVLVQAQIIKLLGYLQQEFDVTYLFISHNLNVVRRICSRIAVMFQGRIIEVASTEELIRNPVHPYTQALLKAALTYTPSEEEGSWDLDESADMQECSPGHWVMPC